MIAMVTNKVSKNFIIFLEIRKLKLSKMQKNRENLSKLSFQKFPNFWNNKIWIKNCVKTMTFPIELILAELLWKQKIIYTFMVSGIFLNFRWTKKPLGSLSLCLMRDRIESRAARRDFHRSRTWTESTSFTIKALFMG